MKIIAVIILAVLLAAAGAWYWQKNQSASPQEEPSGIGAQIFDAGQNPLKERMPDANPFSADTNPFDAKTNPFKSEYKNPFQ